MLIRLAGATGSAAALVALLTSCSGGGAGTPPAPDPSAQARDAVQATFTGYTRALLARDFTGACAALTDQAAKALVTDINTKNIPAQTCEQAYAALYSVSEAAQKLDESNRTVRVTDVTVDGDVATLAYSGTAGGRPVQQTVRVQRGPGGWRIAPAG